MSNEYLDIAMEKVVSQEVNKILKQIKDEIENLNCEYIDYNTGCSAYVSQNDVLQIINNHTQKE